MFSLIEESGSKGIWIKDIRDRSGLSETQMKRVLKTLEKKKHVKAVKAVGTTRKCYMLFNIEAHESVSGGIFYRFIIILKKYKLQFNYFFIVIKKSMQVLFKL